MAEFIFYDGHCGLCHWLVRIVAGADKVGVFRFSPLGSERFVSLVPAGARGSLPDSIVVRTADGRIVAKSAAVRHILRELGGAWSWLAAAMGLLPARLLDLAYDCVARVRHRFFGRPSDVCPTVPPELRSRFEP